MDAQTMDAQVEKLIKKLDNLFSKSSTSINSIIDSFGDAPIAEDLRNSFNYEMEHALESLTRKFNKIRRIHNGEYQKEVVAKYQWFIDTIRSHFPVGTDLVGKTLKFKSPQNSSFDITEVCMLEQELGVYLGMAISWNYGPNGKPDGCTIECKFDRLPKKHRIPY